MNTPRQDEFWEDRLRQTIRDAESDPEAQAWDTPSEAVWEQVSEVLEEKRRRLPLLLWWGSLAAGVLLTVGGLWLVAENQLQLRSQQAEKTEQQISGKGQLHPEKAVSEAPSIGSPSATDTEIPGQQRSSRQGKPEKNSKITQHQASQQVDQNPAKNRILNLTPEFSTNNSTALPSTQPENDASQAVVVNFDAVDPLTTLEAASVSMKFGQAGFSTLPVKTPKQKIQWWAGVHAGPVYTVNSVRTHHPGALLFRKQETSQLSSEQGVAVKMVLPSGWYAQAGISQYRIRQSASQVFRLRFERARERQLPSGEWESTFALSVPSSYGDSEAEIDLRRDDSNLLQEGQTLIVETKSTQALQYQSYCLGSGFLKSSGRWMYGAGAGIALNVLKAREFSLTAQSRQAGIRLPETRIRRSFSEAKGNTTDLQLSATLGYRMSPRWMVGIEPTLRHSLSPVVRHSGFSTAATSAGLQLSVHYLL